MSEFRPPSFVLVGLRIAQTCPIGRISLGDAGNLNRPIGRDDEKSGLTLSAP